ncbi:MAG: hypothetical protein JXR49_22065 [Acidobacteria bacterium]|nr:hypothetical protein [Acidobacteriota bacterium]
MPDTKESDEEKRIRHIEEMKEQVLRLVEDPECFYLDDSLSLEVQEKFLERILFMEECDEQPLFEYLEKGGIRLPKPEALDDAQLHSKLWEVINAMALAGHFLSSTDHLSDRELYEHLWRDILPEPTSIPADNASFCHIDILGGCSDEDMKIRLKYYADDDERECWESDFPDDEIPPKEPLPYDRDRHLPSPEYNLRTESIAH